MSGVDMAFLGRPDPLEEATKTERYEAQVRIRMTEHRDLLPRVNEPGHRNEVRKRRAELHTEIDLLLDMIAVARIVG